MLLAINKHKYIMLCYKAKEKKNTKKKIHKIQQQTHTHTGTQRKKEMTLIWTKIYNHKTR